MADFAAVKALLVAASMCLALPAGARAQEGGGDQDTPESARRETLREIENAKNRFPVVEPMSLSDLLSSRLERGFLIIELKEPPEVWPFVVPIKGNENALARISISRKPRDASDAESPPTQRFTLILDVVGEEGSSVAITKVHAFAGPLFGQLNMSMDRVHSDGTYISVQMIQLLPGADNQPPIALHLSRNRLGAEEADLRLIVPAESFVALSRAEPELFEEFVRPMLAELGMAGLFEYTVRELAVQAFLRDLPVEAETATRVERLLKQLDAADFGEREAAQKALAELGRPAATMLARLADERELSPEQATRVRGLLVRYEKAQAEQIQARLSDVEFLQSVAALQGEDDDAMLAELARKRLSELSGGEPASRPAASN